MDPLAPQDGSPEDGGVPQGARRAGTRPDAAGSAPAEPAVHVALLPVLRPADARTPAGASDGDAPAGDGVDLAAAPAREPPPPAGAGPRGPPHPGGPRPPAPPHEVGRDGGGPG
ncbi:hypothetical protein MHY29_11235, partial [Micrococcus sp. ACRRV]|nr:hypothetical protein [Micrococcus sp. ACRRV]